MNYEIGMIVPVTYCCGGVNRPASLKSATALRFAQRHKKTPAQSNEKTRKAQTQPTTQFAAEAIQNYRR
jgi:hypothetical protein